MAFTLNRRLAQLVDSNGQLNTGKIPNDYITSDHVADNTITSAMLHTSFTVSTSNLTAIDTDDVSEGSTNLYYTDARARGAVSATGSLSYNSSTGVFSFTQGDTDTVSEGSTNLYFTNARVDSHLSGGTGVTYSSGEISIGQDVGTSATPTFGNITTTGYIAGPATFTIDPAAVGNNTGTVVIAGNLQVDGTTTTINSTTMEVDDLNITLASGAANAAAADGAGLTVDCGSDTDATFTYDGTNDRWDFNKFIEIGSGYGGTPNTDSQLILNDSGNNYITIGSGATSEGGILFADSGDNDVGIISYNHSTDILSVTAPNGIQFNDKLHIVASDPVTNQTLIEFLNTSGYGIYARTNSIGARGNTLEFIASDYNNNSAQTHEVLTLRPEGNVGIGTDNPGFALDISNTTSAKINLQGGTNQNGIRFASAGNDGVSSSLYYLGVGSDLMGGTDYGALLLDVTNNRSVLFDDQSTSRLGFYNNSMVIHSSGKVGIGDTSAGTYQLKVDSGSNGTSDALAGIFVEGQRSGVVYNLVSNNTANAANRGSGIQFRSGGFLTSGIIGRSDAVAASGDAPGYLTFHTSTDGSEDLAERMRIDSSGNVGIGTSNPSGNKSITIQAGADSSASLRLKNDAHDWDVNCQTNDKFAIYSHTAGTERLVIDTSGNVGIGTNNPASKLHILGPGGGTTTDLRICSPDNNTSRLTVAEDTTGDQHGAFFEYKGGDLDKTQIGIINNYTESNLIMFRDNTYAGFGSNLTNPLQNLVVGTTTNYDPPGLGNTNANFAILKRDASSSGDYGIITGISNDGNVWSQVQRTDGTATAYNLYLQPSGGSVGIGVPQNHPFIPNLIYPLRVAKQRSGTGNVTDYLAKIAIDGMGYGGSNYQMAAVDFTGGDTASKSGNLYGRIGCSSMNGANNAEEGSLEFFVRAPGYSMETAEAMKICGKVDTSSAGGGTTRNGILFPFQGLAIDRSWANYPCINVMNSTHYSSSSSTQSELRIHGNNVSSDSYPGTSGSDFSCTVRADGGYATGSDRRRKRNITTIDDALSKVKQLTGKRFQTVNRSEEVQEHVSKNGYKLGFIAQEVEDIIPEAVQYHADEDDGTENWNSAYAMDYGSVVALLVNAIKEQDTTIQDLKSRIETLEG